MDTSTISWPDKTIDMYLNNLYSNRLKPFGCLGVLVARDYLSGLKYDSTVWTLGKTPGINAHEVVWWLDELPIHLCLHPISQVVIIILRLTYSGVTVYHAIVDGAFSCSVTGTHPYVYLWVLSLDDVGVFIVACPKDITMFRDAVKTAGQEDKIVVKDLIELVHEAMDLDKIPLEEE